MNTKMRLVSALAIAMAVSLPAPANAKEGSASLQPTIEHRGGKQIEVEKAVVNAEAEKLIFEFVQSKPEDVFERVRLTMADEIEAKNALTLDDAYVVAVDRHYTVTVSNYKKYGLSEEDWMYLIGFRERKLQNALTGQAAK